MEDSKPANLNPDGGESEARFADLCKSVVVKNYVGMQLFDDSEGSFLALRNHFSLDEKTLLDAKKLFTESKSVLLTNMSAMGSTPPEELERYLSAFVLYSVKRLGERPTGDASEGPKQTGVTLCQILRTVRLNLVDFFKELPQFIVKIGPILSNIYGADWEKKLEARISFYLETFCSTLSKILAKELQANFVHLSLLSKYYKRAYQEFFQMNEADKQPADGSSFCSGYISEYHKFGWLLFLALRVHAFGRFKDLVTCTNGLVAVLAVLIIHVPTRLRKFSVLDSPFIDKKTDRGINLIAVLCHIYDTSEDDVKKMMEKANDLIAHILEKKPLVASACKTENVNNIDPDGLIYFEDLLEDSSLLSSISVLEKDYDSAVSNRVEIDERVFVNEDDSLLGSGSLSGGAVNISGTKRKFDALASPTKTITSPLSPSRSPARHTNVRGSVNVRIAGTPVSTAMTTAKWLRTVISPLPSKPSAQLEKFFTSCDRDVSNEVVRRASIILEAIFPNSALGERCVSGSLPNANLMDNIWAQQRRLEALKLYYRVLEAMCMAEAPLHANNLTSLLTNERFHRCMLACSAELVLATHKTVTMLFPAVLEKTGITAFDLSKVIESFIRHEDSLPRELRRHLNSLEERLLESMVWEKGSSMYNSLIIARPSLSVQINRQGLLAEPMPSLDAIAVHISGTYGGLPPLPCSQKHDSTAGPNGDIRSPKRAATEYRSVLIERNSFTSPVKDRLISNLKQKLTPPVLHAAFASPTRPTPGGGGETCAETEINRFFSKTVKLAAFRIKGMVEKLQLPEHLRESVYCLFQKILNQQTPLFFNRHIDQIILCSIYGVAKRQGQDHVDIITFYNEIFISSVKPLLVELGAGGTSVRPNLVPEVSNDKDAQCPGSPKVSTFPTLPDMSPKKVSAVHNVYVSPLRSSKMDALISNGSKSYYACVGESTHAYQSPSKDLTAINDRLNSNNRSRVRGALNFEADVGLVSDSLVANSLCLQNGHCATSSVASPKTEQPDC
ncbi:hypothetical protein Cgig2_033093 [Carnegiea gigantea]|uniref:Retinoblastoma-related protein n=1 Tax=Carnegiea gigantea TaxID=171969 RepID=A0A9Q1GZT6_9CARY|nr:hypothetical protein Cgig2_033093 [Carnegiea gigantea]